MKPGGIVTAEQVASSLPTAPLGRRVKALVLDAACSLLTLVLVMGLPLTYMLTGRWLPNVTVPDGMGDIFVVALVIWSFLYMVLWFKASRRGQSVGKWLMGLQVVRSDLQAAPPLGRGCLVVRSIVKGLMFPLFALDLFLVLRDRHRRSVADRLCKSRVIIKDEVQ